MTKKIKVTVSTGWANGDHVDYWDLPIHWDELDEEQKQITLHSYAEEYLHETCESYAEVAEDED